MGNFIITYVKYYRNLNKFLIFLNTQFNLKILEKEYHFFYIQYLNT